MAVERMAFRLFTHARSNVSLLRSLLGVGDQLVGDREFCSFAHLAMLAKRSMHGLFWLPRKQIVDVRVDRRARGKCRPKFFVKRLGWHDQIVEWARPSTKPNWMDPELPPPRLLVWELR